MHADARIIRADETNTLGCLCSKYFVVYQVSKFIFRSFSLDKRSARGGHKISMFSRNHGNGHQNFIIFPRANYEVLMPVAIMQFP